MLLPPSLSWLKTLSKSPTVGQLKKVAQACGVSSNGTKRVVTDRILASLAGTRALSADDRILSIDMGLRNFAFCLLTPATNPRQGQGLKPKEPIVPSLGGSEGAAEVRTPPPLMLHDWKVLDLTEDSVDIKNNQALSPVAVDLVNRHLLPLKPTHIIIEQQRYRSAGAAAVLEWTLRVNALEAMLHAILTAMRSLELWKGEVTAVDPLKAAPFFFVEDGRLPSKQLKKMKIDLLGKWISTRDTKFLELGSPHVTKLADSFLEHWKPVKGTRGGKSKATEGNGEKHFKKLDDLTDCVIQGAAWASWQQTRHILAQEGIEEKLTGLIGRR
ncbi:hypothetical protein MCOR25_002324 [Pyricularia grisea]|uniref:Mitochondrial resolvase Ydc2 catalytic domain-containing protein n=1 Tax=Pyricularia grisea TaxID=148305 RepID=A0A6P8AT58_PYRGI|nr:uncharacterized protein PgNI_09786 [Pyricularia grisea]KAI6378078.1 hypothetical protein MCOR25_002324 [Pyricularia grisea]TLD05277.1 hypothetical protein PgNI_09786 [Pyricularia grisea]